MVKVGQYVSFIPFHETCRDKDRWKDEKDIKPVVGRVFKVNRRGVVFVEYEVNGVTLRESFLLVDIGKTVKIMEEGVPCETC